MDQSQVAESVHKTEPHNGQHNVTRRERGMSRESSTVPVCASPVNAKKKSESKRNGNDKDNDHSPIQSALCAHLP